MFCSFNYFARKIKNTIRMLIAINKYIPDDNNLNYESNII